MVTCVTQVLFRPSEWIKGVTACHCHLWPDPLPSVILRKLLAYPPPPPSSIWMAGFMNSPLLHQTLYWGPQYYHEKWQKVLFFKKLLNKNSLLNFQKWGWNKQLREKTKTLRNVIWTKLSSYIFWWLELLIFITASRTVGLLTPLLLTLDCEEKDHPTNTVHHPPHPTRHHPGTHRYKPISRTRGNTR